MWITWIIEKKRAELFPAPPYVALILFNGGYDDEDEGHPHQESEYRNLDGDDYFLATLQGRRETSYPHHLDPLLSDRVSALEKTWVTWNLIITNYPELSNPGAL